ncbi:hypothetical protein NEF87_001726 [Candidatus Lokiarchaeum ossiferum]|uniref:DUF211 domain-containing protein n=1 Tax=Candidatus Lokiarchaeum ossiferum TaxID=2951803 RepID=A0ABY6HPU3_9ARCH|nr:hypothetical protein NEF87_001726 [Candidatus Lokiarchaeum sp. B-35]
MGKKTILRLVLDILKAYDPEINLVCEELIEKCVESHISGVNITVTAMDRLTQGVKIVIEGSSLDYDEINDVLVSMNCVVHSLDQCVAGERLVEEIDTPQD